MSESPGDVPNLDTQVVKKSRRHIPCYFFVKDTMENLLLFIIALPSDQPS